MSDHNAEYVAPEGSFESYIYQVIEAQDANLGWRRGQAAFNVLHGLRPDLSEHLRGGPLDPFYASDADPLNEFFDWVENHWRGDVGVVLPPSADSVTTATVMSVMSDHPIGFFDGEYKFLSNFSRYGFFWAHPALPLVYWPTVEHAYQAAKTLDRERAWAIRTAPRPGEAKRMGNDRNLTALRQDWEPDYKFEVMLELLRLKFSESDLRQKLLATENRTLIEGNTWHDNIFGVCVCSSCRKENKSARNMLGKLLEQVRAEIAS
jgi:ribA/ribD-fused uncharacterized protein